MWTSEKGTPVEVVDRNAYQEFIYCPYCNHCHTQVPGWENWGMVFKVICERCGLIFRVDIVQLVVRDAGDKIWLGVGFDSEKDSFNSSEDLMRAFHKTIKPEYRYLAHDPPLQNIPGSLADVIDKLFWR
jgi:hypothetical protein